MYPRFWNLDSFTAQACTQKDRIIFCFWELTAAKPFQGLANDSASNNLRICSEIDLLPQGIYHASLINAVLSVSQQSCVSIQKCGLERTVSLEPRENVKTLMRFATFWDWKLIQLKLYLSCISHLEAIDGCSARIRRKTPQNIRQQASARWCSAFYQFITHRWMQLVHHTAVTWLIMIASWRHAEMSSDVMSCFPEIFHGESWMIGPISDLRHNGATSCYKILTTYR